MTATPQGYSHTAKSLGQKELVYDHFDVWGMERDCRNDPSEEKEGGVVGKKEAKIRL